MRRPSKADGDSTDEQLMQSLVAGKDTEEVLRTLYRRYVRTVYGTGSKLLGDRSLAEELVQEVFLKVWRSSWSFDASRGSFSTWLYRVTRSVAVDLHRRRIRNVVTVNGVDGKDPDVANVRDQSTGPQQTVEDSWLAWRMSKALESLDDPYREVIELAYFQGLSQREIAQKPAYLWVPLKPEPIGL